MKERTCCALFLLENRPLLKKNRISRIAFGVIGYVGQSNPANPNAEGDPAYPVFLLCGVGGDELFHLFEGAHPIELLA